MTEPVFDQLLRRLSEAGVEFVLIGGLAVNAWGVVRDTKDVELASGRRVPIETELGLLDVVQGLDGIPGYTELRVSAVETEILGDEVAVCSMENLRQMKEAAGRPRDRVDIEDLDATRASLHSASRPDSSAG